MGVQEFVMLGEKKIRCCEFSRLSLTNIYSHFSAIRKAEGKSIAKVNCFAAR